MDVIPVIDLRLLTQTEINTLALSSTTFSSSSSSARTFSYDEDTLVTQIDRSVFNESAGSRKQTYSRLCLAPPKSNLPTSATSTTTSTGRRRGRPRSLAVPSSTSPSSAPDASSPSTAPASASDELGRKENNQIVRILQKLLAKNGHSETLAFSNLLPSPIPGFIPNPLPQSMPKHDDDQHRTKGRKKKRVREEGGDGDVRDIEILNVNGVVIDVVQLGKKEDLFRDELAKRTAGLVTEAEFLGFLDGLEGQWGSRRKRRKIVDAGCLGDELPKGWKLLLGLKRKDGAVWVNCRRYVSPSGKQFTSCKEVSSFLLFLVGSQDVRSTSFVIQEEGTIAHGEFTAGRNAGKIHQDGKEIDAVSCFSGVSPSSVYVESGKQITVSEVNNSPKNQILNLLKCLQCNLIFPDKASHVQHLLKFHHRNPKKHRIGKSIASGVIIKDGKYECQFCHKVFIERHRYNGHVGIHVRNYPQSLNLLTDDVIVKEGSEVNATESGEKENLVKDSCSSEPIYEVNGKNTHGATVRITNNTATDSLIDVSCSKSADECANNSDHADGKLGNYIENTNVQIFELSVGVALGSYAKEINPVSTCELIKKSIPESNLESPTKFIADELVSYSVTNEKQEDASGSSNPMDAEYILSLSTNNDQELASPQFMSETSVKVLGDTNNIIGEDYGNPFKINNGISSENVCNSKCSLDKTNDSKTEVFDDQSNLYCTLHENSRCIADTDNTAVIGFDCDPEYAALGTTAKDNSNMHDDSHFGSHSKTDGTVFSINEPSNIHLDIHTNARDDSHCNSKFSANEEALNSQFGLNEMMNEKSCSTQRNGANIKHDISLDVNNSSFCSGTVPCETSFGQSGVLAQNGLLAELCFENNLSLPPCSSVQSYNAKVSATDVMKASSSEENEFTEADDYGIQNRVIIPPSDGSQACDVEKSVTCQMRGSSNELGIDSGFGLSGSNKDSVMSTGVVGGSGALDVGLLNTPSLWLQPSNCPTATGMVSNQDMSKLHGTPSHDVDHYHPSADFGEIRLDRFGLSDSLILTNESSEMRTEDTMGLSSCNSGGLGDVYVPPVQLGRLEDVGNNSNNSHDDDITTVCMWCGVEYNNQQSIIKLQQPQSGTVGFICPRCKSKMCGQLKF